MKKYLFLFCAALNMAFFSLSLIWVIKEPKIESWLATVGALAGLIAFYYNAPRKLFTKRRSKQPVSNNSPTRKFDQDDRDIFTITCNDYFHATPPPFGQLYRKDLRTELKEILRSHKALECWKGQKTISKSSIIEYTVKRFTIIYNVDANKWPMSKWDRFFNSLESIGLIKIQEEEVLRERLYLNKVIFYYESTQDIYTEIVSFYPDITTCNQLIYHSVNYSSACDILNIMRSNGINPNLISYNLLISKSDTLPEAFDMLSSLIKDGFTPDQNTIDALLNKCRSFDEVIKVLDAL